MKTLKISLLLTSFFLLIPSPTLAVTISNNKPADEVGYWEVDILTGGESRQAILTAHRFASNDTYTENVLYDYFSYVDVGADGGAVQLSGTDNPSEPVFNDSSNTVSSTGSFTGENGNTIDWTATSWIVENSTVMTTRFTFTTRDGGGLGTLRFLQYLDEDVGNLIDNVLLIQGSATNGNLELFTIDNNEVYGVSQSGVLISSGPESGLYQAAFIGWAADAFDNMIPRIVGEGQEVSESGVINNLPIFSHPQLGQVYGPADVVSVLAWDVDPEASTAVVTTSLGGQPDEYIPPPPLPLLANQWGLISLPVVANTVENLFGDDLDPADYGERWGLYEWNADAQQYSDLLTLQSTLAAGKGYWLMTLDSGQSIDVEGDPNPAPPDMDIVLKGAPAGRLNMVGYPYVTNGCWANAKVIDGGQEIPLSMADPNGTCWTTPAPGCLMSRIMYKWNGSDSAYQAYDAMTNQAEGTLSAFDGLWVNAFKDGIKLRLVNTCTAPDANAAKSAATSSAAWWLRLTVASGNLRDPGNLLGRLSDSRNGYDAHDLPELAADVSPYLTIVFPRPNWGAQTGDYTTDYRRARKIFEGGAWNFEVRSDVARTITLSAKGSPEALARSRLFDWETGRWLKRDKKGCYTVKMVGPVHRLRWWVK